MSFGKIRDPCGKLSGVLQELWNTLRPGGVLFCSNPRGNNQEGWSDTRMVVTTISISGGDLLPRPALPSYSIFIDRQENPVACGGAAVVVATSPRSGIGVRNPRRPAP